MDDNGFINCRCCGYVQANRQGLVSLRCEFSTLYLCHKQGISEDLEGVTGVILIEEW